MDDNDLIDACAALCWQGAHVIRMAAALGENAQLRSRVPTWLSVAELRDQLAKMDIQRRRIERWLDDLQAAADAEDSR